MRLSELLGKPVVDEAGGSPGSVLDVRLVQDGPAQGPLAAFRLHGLVVGRFAAGAQMGFDRAAVKGPWIVKAPALWLHRSDRYVPWSRVREVQDDRVTISGSIDDLQAPEPLT